MVVSDERVGEQEPPADPPRDAQVEPPADPPRDAQVGNRDQNETPEEDCFA